MSIIPEAARCYRMFSVQIAAAQAVAAVYTADWPMLVFALLIVAARMIDQPKVRNPVERGI